MKSTMRLLHLLALIIGAGFLPSLAADVSSVPLTSNQAAFAADIVDVEWSAQKKKEIGETLSGASNPEIECKSSICRVTLTWTDRTENESWEQFTRRVAKWTEETSKRGGFVRADTNFRPNNPTTVSYFSVKRLTTGIPPGLGPEAAAAFQKCLSDSAETLRRQGPAESATPSVSTCTL